MPEKPLLDSPSAPSAAADPAQANTKSLDKTFDPAHFEERWYSRWEADGRFQPRGPAGDDCGRGG